MPGFLFQGSFDGVIRFFRCDPFAIQRLICAPVILANSGIKMPASLWSLITTMGAHCILACAGMTAASNLQAVNR